MKMELHSRPLVSIIMAVKDTAPFLPKCLTSILGQSYHNWELIAVNDHSTDHSLQILQEFAAKDRRIRLFDSPGQRLIPALKEGFKRSLGILINRMDSDDWMPSDKLASMVSEWLRYGIGFVIAGGTQHFVDEGDVGAGFKRYDQWLNQLAKSNSHFQQIYQECVIPSHCWIIHRDDLSAAGAFEPEVYPEDYDLCFRFYRSGYKIVGIDKVLHFWRDRSNRISRTLEEYRDNRFFAMKLKYFYELDRDRRRPLVVWGAGRNGKDFIKELSKYEESIHWVCDNENKIGKNIFGIIIAHYDQIITFNNPQILIVVSAPEGKIEISKYLERTGKKPVKDFWFFT